MLTPSVRRGTMKGLRRFALGAATGGLVTGSALGIVVWLVNLLPSPSIGVIRVIVLGLLLYVTVLTVVTDSVRLPQSRRQVPIGVFAGGVDAGAFAFGLELGSGVRTYVTSMAPYWALIAAVIAGVDASPWPVVVAGLLFGLGRVMTVVIGLRAEARGHHPVAWWNTSAPWVNAVATALCFGIVATSLLT